MHKPEVYIDLSGWSPKYFPPQLVQYANTLLKHQVLFGSDYPMITPDRWLQRLRAARDRRRGAAADPQGERRPPARPEEQLMIDAGGPAPDFTLDDQDGDAVELSDLRGKLGARLFLSRRPTRRAVPRRPAAPATTRPTTRRRTPWCSASRPTPSRTCAPSPTSTGSRSRCSRTRGARWPSVRRLGREAQLGTHLFGNQRSSVLVDPEGNVARVFPNVKPAEHDELVLGALRELAA